MAMERFSNDGSPSGFSDINTTSPGHRPSDPVPHFLLPLYHCSDFNPVRLGGFTKVTQALYPVHPDMVDRFERLTKLKPALELKAAPTSSPRTLYVEQPSCPLFIKLAYQGLIGRVTRRMTRRHVTSAIEVSLCFKDAIESKRLPKHIQIMHEYSGTHFGDEGPLTDWGFVERNPLIAGFPNAILVPSFSLFATRGGSVPPLLHQLMNLSASLLQPEAFFDQFLIPLLDLYFDPVIALGLQAEAHAQNVIYLLDSQYSPVAVALRDMESVDKDAGIMEYFGLAPKITDYTYKTLNKTDYNYQIMHSFMFDFKLGHYLLGPMVDCWGEKAGNSAVRAIEEMIRAYSKKKADPLPDDFFPKDVWYNYDPVVHEGSSRRKYNSFPNPRFR